MNETPRIVRTEPLQTARIHLAIPREEMPTVMGPALHELLEVLAAQGLQPAGPPFAHHHRITPEVFDFDVCFPVAQPVKAAGRVEPGRLPATTCVRTVYAGPYEGLPAAWQQFDEWAASEGHACREDVIERYLTGPESGPDPAGWRTELNRPLTAEGTARVGHRAIQVTTPSDREIRTERVFQAPRQRVWEAFTTPALLARWWGRGNRVDIERMDVERGGHWRFVEHGPEGVHGFEGRYREVTPPERLAMTFEWDGMPGHVAVDTSTFEDLGDGRTRVVTTTLFHTAEEAMGMACSGMEAGLAQSYEALDRVLAERR